MNIQIIWFEPCFAKENGIVIP